jgi:hypothetical protein
MYQGCKKKLDLEQESRRIVRANMRLLARLFLAFKEHNTMSKNAESMFERKHFENLEMAIEEVSTREHEDEEQQLKYGMKYKIYYLLKNSAEILKAYHRTNMADQKASEINHLLEVLKFHHNSIFGNATYAINKARAERLTAPERLPLEDDVQCLRDYICKGIQNMTATEQVDYVTLRDLLCARLTLFKARRGNEAGRMKVSHWMDAKSRRWLDSAQLEDLDALEKQVVEESLICYMRGKNGKQVPVIIPSDCVSGMQMLADPSLRKAIGTSSCLRLLDSRRTILKGGIVLAACALLQE